MNEFNLFFVDNFQLCCNLKFQVLRFTSLNIKFARIEHGSLTRQKTARGEWRENLKIAPRGVNAVPQPHS